MVEHWYKCGVVEIGLAPGFEIGSEVVECVEGVEVVVAEGSGGGYRKSIASTIDLDALRIEEVVEGVEEQKQVADRLVEEDHMARRAAGFRVPLREFWQRKGKLRVRESFDP